MKQYEFDRLLYEELRTALDALSEKGIDWRDVVVSFQKKVKNEGLPSEVQEALLAAGMTEAEIEAYRKRLIQLDPQRIEAWLTSEQKRLEMLEQARTAATSWPELADLAMWRSLEYLARRLLQEAEALTSGSKTIQNPTGIDEVVQLRPGLLEALRRRASFTRAHHGSFAAAIDGNATDSSNFAAGWHTGDRLVCAWHQQKNKVVFAAFNPRGETLIAPQVIGTGHWPRLAADGQRTAVAWQSGDGFAVRLHDGKQWGDEIALSGREAAFAFAPDGPLYAATSTGLWRLTDGRFERMQETSYSQPAIAVDRSGQPHVAWQHDGHIVYSDADLGQGERPSLAIAPDGTVHIAYLSASTLVMRSLQAGAWSPPKTIPARNPSWPALALGTDGVRLTYLGAAESGPDALWLVRQADSEPVLVPSLAGNVTDAWFMLKLQLPFSRAHYAPHDILITVNDVWVKFFENAVPEGRYLFRLNPYHIFTSSGRPVPNRIAAYRWYGNSGTNLMWSDYRLIVRTAWSEYYAFASTPEEVIQANQAIWRLNHNQPDLMVLANTLNLPVKAPVGSVDFPMTIANLGEADSRPARLAMLAEQGVLARADIPLLKPGEQVTITMRLEGRLKSAQFQIEYAESGYKDFDSSNDALDLMLWTEADYDKARRLVPNPPPVPPEPKITMRPTPNDAFPPWVAGQLPAGAKAIGDWLWEPTPTFNVLRSHTASTTEGRVLHYFIRAADRLPLAPGDNLVQYVYLDTQSPPQQILLQLFVEGSKEGQAVYWGGDEDLLQVGSEAAKRLGDLPEPGKWVRLRVPVEMFGVRNAWINGLLFGQYEGRAYWGPTSKSVSRLDQTSEVMVVSEK